METWIIYKRESLIMMQQLIYRKINNHCTEKMRNKHQNQNPVYIYDIYTVYIIYDVSRENRREIECKGCRIKMTKLREKRTLCHLMQSIRV